jgi:hypothetical protein
VEEEVREQRMLDNRWLRTTKYVAGLLLLATIVSCNTASIGRETTKLLSPPVITATPLEWDFVSDNISEVITKQYDLQDDLRGCILDRLHSNTDVEKPEVEIVDQTNRLKIQAYEIADNVSNTYRAYLSEEPATSMCVSCVKSQVYVENRTSGETFKISWQNNSSIFRASQLMWMGDSIIAILHNTNPDGGLLIGIDIDKQDYAYFADVIYFCEPTK